MRAAVLLALGLVSAAEAAVPLAPGTYRLEMRVASHATIPLLGESGSTTVSVAIVWIRDAGGVLEQTHRVCDARLEGAVPLFRIEMPAAFVAALGTHTYPIALAGDEDGWRYRADLGVETVGWHADDGALPTRLDDPRVYDSDGDGRPAATLRLTIPIAPDGELYVVQRGHSVLDGRVVAADRIEGSVDVRRFEQAVVKARPGFLARSPDVTQDPARSRFVLARVADGAECADLVDR